MNNRPFLQAILFIAIGLITTVLLLVAKLVFEQTDAGHRIESYGYETLQSYLPPFVSREELPVIVVDIGQLEGGTDKSFTPRDKLKEIISAIAKENPKAIAVDIDFSPEEDGGWQDQNDPEFFDYCLSLKGAGIPIFLGVERSIKSLPEAWLGLEKYKSLAAGMRFQSPDTNRVVLWTKWDYSAERIPSISLALTKSYRGSLPKPPAPLTPMLREIEDYSEKTENLRDSEITYANALVNYNVLKSIESQSLGTISSTSVAEEGKRFRNKLVLIGRITDTNDQHIVPGSDIPVAGVLLHASTTYTLIKFPLFEFTYKARILLDLMLPLFILIVIAVIRYQNREKSDYDWHRKEWSAIIIAVVFVFVGGVILTQWLGIIWFDFLIVIIALLLHPIVGKKIGTGLHQ